MPWNTNGVYKYTGFTENTWSSKAWYVGTENWTDADGDLFTVKISGAGQWTSDLTGNLGDFNTDLNELGFTDSSNTYFHLEIEHSTPLLPNVQLESTSISASGTGTLTASYQIGTQTFAISTSVKSDLDLSLTDLVLYYKPLKHLE